MSTRISQFNRPFKRTKLDELNDKRKYHQLHPTKGFRHMDPYRSQVAHITAEMKRGVRYSTAEIKAALAEARKS